MTDTASFTPTHVTVHGALVAVTERNDLGDAFVTTRTGTRSVLAASEVHELGTLGAEEILESLGLRAVETPEDTDARATEAEADRVEMAERYIRCDNARTALALSVQKVLNNYDSRSGLSSNARMILEAGLDVARAVIQP